MNQQLTALEQDALQAAAAVATEHDLQLVRARFLGRKGELTALMKGMGDLSPEQRPLFGAMANQVKEKLEALFDACLVAIRDIELQRRLSAEQVDVTLPGRRLRRGSKHPVTQVTEELVAPQSPSVRAAPGCGLSKPGPGTAPVRRLRRWFTRIRAPDSRRSSADKAAVGAAGGGRLARAEPPSVFSAASAAMSVRSMAETMSG